MAQLVNDADKQLLGQSLTMMEFSDSPPSVAEQCQNDSLSDFIA